MRIVGLDWSTTAPGRGLVVLESDASGLRVSQVSSGVLDEDILELLTGVADVLAVDVPFGWPAKFTDFVGEWTAESAIHAVPVSPDFRFRETDRAVRAVTGKWPLAVSADRIALSARAWAAFVGGRSESCGIDVGYGAPSAASRVVEVYPAGSLLAFGCELRDYKRNAATRREILAQLPDVELAGHADELVASDDSFDAYVAALTGAAYGGALVGWGVAGPSDLDADTIRREGWIFLPNPSS